MLRKPDKLGLFGPLARVRLNLLPGPLKMSSTSNRFHNNMLVLCTRLCTFFLSQIAGTREIQSINRLHCTTNLPSLCLM